MPEKNAEILAEFDRVAREITDPAYQQDLERRVHERLAAENRWHNYVLARSRELADHEVLRAPG